MTLSDVIRVLRRRWRLVATATALVMLVAGVTTRLTIPVYTATSKVYLSATQTEAGGAYIITQDDLRTYVDVLNSPSVLDDLRRAAELPTSEPITVSGEVTDTNLLMFSATGSNPDTVARVANEVGPVMAVAATRFSPLLAVNKQNVASTTISPAVAPDTPISPNLKRTLAIALLLGLALGVGAALLLSTLDTRVRTEEDIARVSARPVIGEVPLVKGGFPPGTLSVADRPRGPHAEAIRSLRTGLMFLDATTESHSLVVTSTRPGEGKTTATINLALALAETDMRVLLVDADLRRPAVATALAIDGSFGLTTVLVGQAPATDLIQEWRDTNLHVLPAGPVPPNPSELLGSNRMRQLFTQLDEDFDFIIIDSPPIGAVADAVLIDQLTHGLLMIVDAAGTRSRELARAIGTLSKVGVAVSGFALNRVRESDQPSYAYGHGYGYPPLEATPAQGTRAARRRAGTSRAGP